jgi:hypothetical protein
VRRVVTDPVVIDKSVPEHVEIRRLIARLREMAPGDAGYDRTFSRSRWGGDRMSAGIGSSTSRTRVAASSLNGTQ